LLYGYKSSPSFYLLESVAEPAECFNPSREGVNLKMNNHRTENRSCCCRCCDDDDDDDDDNNNNEK